MNKTTEDAPAEVTSSEDPVPLVDDCQMEGSAILVLLQEVIRHQVNSFLVLLTKLRMQIVKTVLVRQCLQLNQKSQFSPWIP